MPCVMSHASIDPAVRAARGLPEDLIRLCVGIEDPTDLIEDLEVALLQAGAIKPSMITNRLGLQSPDPQPQAELINKAIEKLADRRGVYKEEQESTDWAVSAPGKVILFGEHAVVHGVTAVAASVNLRCYGLSSARNDGKIRLHLPDLNFDHEWDVANDLPWDAVTPVRIGEAHGPELDPQLVNAITNRALPPPGPTNDTRYRSAAIAFLYIYMITAADNYRPFINFTARSSLPVGAGLGSSASYSTCVATTLLLIHKRLSLPKLPIPSKPVTGDDPGHIHVSHAGRRAIPVDFADEVNRWALIAEKVLHGNPSGVDNAVAVYGGALAFTRPGPNRKGGLEGIQGFKSVRFLLVDSRVPRDTKSLVAGVGRLKEQEPERVGAILERIQAISSEARRALGDAELPRSSLLSALAALIEENHAHLVSLGVSHPSLEKIRTLTGADPFGLHTKLTGAGGGGCAVTLIPDGFEDEAIQGLEDALTKEGFTPYLTTVGGSGLGVLSPYTDQPATPEAKADAESAFKITPAPDLAAWAEDRGRWLYL